MKVEVKNELFKKNFFNKAQFALCLIVSTCLSDGLSAQELFFQVPGINTISLRVGDEWTGDPLVYLGDNQDITLSFDELYGDARQLYFEVHHCDATWNKDDLMIMEYWDGFEKNYDMYESSLSFNTTVDYIHYELVIPSSRIKVSGNYLIKVFSQEGELLVTRPFFVAERQVGVRSRVDKNIILGMQELTLAVVYGGLQVSNVLQDIKVAVWQNHNLVMVQWENAPTALHSNEVVYGDELLFEGGNEWRWADSRSIRGHMLTNSRVEFHDPYYHVTLPVDVPAKGYSYHQEWNGAQYIENYDDKLTNSSVGADYVCMHFFLQSVSQSSSVYVVGDIAGCRYPVERNMMEYMPELDAMHIMLWVKQGLANYRFVEVRDDGKVSVAETEGTFGETENNYSIAVYYHDPSEGYDRLVGFKVHNTLKTTNDFIH